VKKRLFKYLRNKYVAAIAIFLLWICFFNDIDIFFIAQSRLDLMGLRKEANELREKNKEAEQSLQEISNNTASLEKFARETYYMKRDNEDVFVFKERAE
jgi:cell division protein FtsB